MDSWSSIDGEMKYISSKRDYKAWADNITRTLSGFDFRAPLGENGLFILLHSGGSLPHNSELNVPLNYAVYYFLEALIGNIFAIKTIQ